MTAGWLFMVAKKNIFPIIKRNQECTVQKSEKRYHALTCRAMAIVLALMLVFQPLIPIFAAENSSASKNYVSEGMQAFKDSFSGVGTPSWLLQKFGVQMGYHLINCATKGEKPDVVKVVKSMATADYMARTAGGLLGTAAGSVFIPVLSSIPVFGGFLADFVPTFTCYLGADIAGSGLKGLKNGSFSFKEYFKKLDWTAMIAGSLGWSAGSLLCSAIFPPIGGIVGGMLGDLIATKLLDKFRKWQGKTDSSPPLMPTGTGGPLRIRAPKPVKASSPVASQTGSESISGQVSVSDSSALMSLCAEYEKKYEDYMTATQHGKTDLLKKVGDELRVIKEKIEELRRR